MEDMKRIFSHEDHNEKSKCSAIHLITLNINTPNNIVLAGVVTMKI